MENLKLFLDSSTIHGLSYLSNTRSCSRLFWLIIVVCGFSVAGYLISKSFYNWQQSPITTTIETLPISQITFPNVTVCPPRNSFLNLNYDIIQSEKIKLDEDTRKELFEHAKELIQESIYEEVLKNLSKMEDLDRFSNWYQGLTKIELPLIDKDNNDQFYFPLTTSATTGNISTQYFGDKFDADKIERFMRVVIRLTASESIKGHKNVTLFFNIFKNTLREFKEKDVMELQYNNLDADLTNFHKNFTGSTDFSYLIELKRDISKEDVKSIKVDFMPGFRFLWHYNIPVEQKKEHKYERETREFVR